MCHDPQYPLLHPAMALTVTPSLLENSRLAPRGGPLPSSPACMYVWGAGGPGLRTPLEPRSLTDAGLPRDGVHGGSRQRLFFEFSGRPHCLLRETSDPHSRDARLRLSYAAR